MLIDSKQIWDDNGYGKDNPFENTVRFLLKEAKERNIKKAAAMAVITEVLLEVKNGKSYPLDRCPCGCEIDKSGTAITHDMLKRIISLGEKIKEEEGKLLIEEINKVILSHIKTQNEDYIKEHMPAKKWQWFGWFRRKPKEEV
jgi:hypothetical protein